MPRVGAAVAVLAFVVIGVTAATATAATAQRSPSATPSPSSEASTRAEPRRLPADQIVLSGDVLVRRGEVVDEVVVLHGTAEIAGVARGDVVVLDGSIAVTGQVSGSVVSVGGGVTLGPNAQIGGDAIARGDVDVADGAKVAGAVRAHTAFTFRAPIDVFGPFATWLAVMASALALGIALLAFAPRASEAVAVSAISSPWKSVAIGVGVSIVVPLVAVAAVLATVVWPLGLSMLFAVWFALSLGFAWSAFALGRRLWGAPRSRWLAFLFGWLALAALDAIPFVGGVVWAFAAIVGLGAATLATWRARRGDTDGGGIVRVASGGGRHRAGSRSERVLVHEAAMDDEGAGI